MKQLVEDIKSSPVVFTMLVTLFILMTTLCIFGYQHSMKYDNWCHSNNGVVVGGRNGTTCVKKDYVIERN